MGCEGNNRDRCIRFNFRLLCRRYPSFDVQVREQGVHGVERYRRVPVVCGVKRRGYR